MQRVKTHRIVTGKVKVLGKLLGTVLGFAAFAVVAGQLVIPESAQAAKNALFRVQRKTYTVLPTTHPTYTVFTVEPPAHGTIRKTSALAAVTTTETDHQDFTLPKAFMDWQGTYYCSPKACWDGYPVSGGYYSYVNGVAPFRASNSDGALTTTTIVFPTVNLRSTGMYTTWPGGQWYPDGQGAPLTPTTAYGGNYDFDRGGYVIVTPGGNAFSGTMRFVYGPNALFYQVITINTPDTSIAWGSYKNLPSTVQSTIGQRESSGLVTRYRVTTTTVSTTTTGHGPPSVTPTMYNTHYEFKMLLTSKGDPVYTAVARYLDTHGNWMTGMLQGYQPIGTFQTRMTHTGYDNRTPDGLDGNLSLVRPRLRHTYLLNSKGELDTNYNSIRVWEMLIKFNGEAPEPGAMWLLGVGIVTLAGLIHLRRR
jgi:hypothetical protein